MAAAGALKRGTEAAWLVSGGVDGVVVQVVPARRSLDKERVS